MDFLTCSVDKPTPGAQSVLVHYFSLAKRTRTAQNTSRAHKYGPARRADRAEQWDFI